MKAHNQYQPKTTNKEDSDFIKILNQISHPIGAKRPWDQLNFSSKDDNNRYFKYKDTKTLIRQVERDSPNPLLIKATDHLKTSFRNTINLFMDHMKSASEKLNSNIYSAVDEGKMGIKDI